MTRRIEPTPPIEMTRDDFRSLLGEGFHTAFRKALDSPESVTIWQAIRALPDKEWREIIDFVVEGFPDKAFTVPKQRRKR